MTKALYFLILAVLLTACKSKPAQPVADDTAAASKQPSLLKKRIDLYEGAWVKSDYIAKVKQTRSVLASVDLVIGVNGLLIDSTQISGDSLRVEVGWDNQNPGGIMLKGIPGKNPNTLQFGEAELGYDTTGGDTTLISYLVYNKQLFTTRYNRVLPVSPDRNLSDVVNYAINKALIAGEYQLKTNGTLSTITFSNDGVVTGLDTYKKYFIENDLKPGPLNNLDLIVFDEFSNKKAVYSYLFKEDELLLYEAKPDAKNKLMVLGKLKYTLKRIK